VLIYDDFVAKIADFGLSRSVAASMTMRVGTTRWTAPEVLCGSHYLPSADVYSFAVLLWELGTLKIPYADTRFSHQLEASIVDGARLPTEEFPPAVASLAADCWHANPAQRPTFTVICERLQVMLSYANSNRGGVVAI
jgi:serine/threonine protein kinase